MTREGPFWDVMEGRAAPPPAAVLLGWELIAVDPEAGTIEVAFTTSAAYYQRPRCTTAPNGRRSGLRTGVSGRSAG